MGNFRNGSSRGRFSGRGGGNFRNNRFSGNRSFSGNRGEGRSEMHDATCDKCGKRCKVPFEPTEGKPIYCSNCFAQVNNSPRSNFAPRTNFTPRRDSGNSVSAEQFSQINAKLDKILKVLQELEITDLDEDSEETEDELDEDSEEAEEELEAEAV